MAMGDQNISNVAGQAVTVHVSPFTRAADFNTAATNLQKELYRRRYVGNVVAKYNALTAALNLVGSPQETRVASPASISNMAAQNVMVDRVGLNGQERQWYPKVQLAYALSDGLKACVNISGEMTRDVQNTGGTARDSGTNPNFRYLGRIPIGLISELTTQTNALAAKRMSGVPGPNANSSLVPRIKSPEIGPKFTEQHGCREVCTGMCTGSCINFCNGCTGCTGSCGVGCGYGCMNSCTGGSAKKSGDCGSSCSGYCTTTNTGGCGNSCSAVCKGDCANICRGGCGQNCSGTCYSTLGAKNAVDWNIGGSQNY